MKRTLKAFLLLFVFNILLIPACLILGFDDLGIPIISVFSICISLIILIIIFAAERRNAYLSKTTGQKRFARKRTVIIVCSIIALCGIGFIIASFANGYKIPQFDKYKDWAHFPGSSNPDVAIDSVAGLYVRNLAQAKGSNYWFIHFTNSDVSYYDSTNGPVSFGVIDSNCTMKVKYEKDVDAYLDDNRLIVIERLYNKEADSCDVYDALTLKKHRQKVYPITISKPYEHYPADGKPAMGYEAYKKLYGSAFYDSLKGVKELDEGGYSGSDDRGYLLFTDTAGKLYTIPNSDDHYSVTLLCENCKGYKLNKGTYSTQTNNIKMLDESIIWKNELSSGFSLGYGNPTGGGNDGFYFSYYQTWLMYYKVTIGTATTSFKAEGGDKDKPYLSFTQLNKPKTNKDVLCFAADNRLWKAYVKQ
ncbi:hypothetical protein R1T16_08535 [Flavobacterium sp. DG1-102-2]|uniref:hypothetical protein n=1 Tax=Flavobacterium sp. DG1-102-2 TaxID=3081663 RepID=UPI00294A1D46|nr:hypothetical protein [Flavobacterium sp. DG1-102-2]MDV6168471.1 hypothetical protein [Flavobacterium sp. DG1-102-2]